MFANLLYILALGALSPFILYRVLRHGRYRRGLSQKLFGLSVAQARALTGGKPCVWLHAVSVGEVNLLPGVVGKLQPRCNAPIVISTSTDTGYDLAVKHFGRDRVFFCPLDFSWAVRRTLRHLTPKQLILAELELWPNLVRLATQANCPVAIINGRLSDRSSNGYQRFRRWTEPVFQSLQWIGCQDEVCQTNFAACGTPPERLSVTGSLKFDDAPTDRATDEVQARKHWARMAASHQVWIVGSTQEGEEQMALDTYQSVRAKYPALRLILVPRHKERFDAVAALVRQSGFQVKRRSETQVACDSTWDARTVILIDTIGELRHWWGVSQIATVGGSFGDRGGQNMLEPAGYGSAVSFGPNTRNFKEIANRLLEAGGAVRVADEAELRAFLERCLDDPSYIAMLGDAAQRVVNQHRGATDHTVDALGELLPQDVRKLERPRRAA